MSLEGYTIEELKAEIKRRSAVAKSANKIAKRERKKTKGATIYRHKENGKLYTIGYGTQVYLGDGPFTAEPYFPHVAPSIRSYFLFRGETIKLKGREQVERDFERVGET
jgi:hypothetical protein